MMKKTIFIALLSLGITNNSYGFFRHMDPHFVEDFFGEFEESIKVNVSDDKKNVIVEASLPGFSKEEIKVTVRNDSLLTISAEKKEETKETKDTSYYRREMRQVAKSRSVSLPVEVVGSGANTEFKDGILKVVIPKKENRPSKTVNIPVR